MLRYVVLRSKGPVALLGCGIALLAVGVAVGKATWFAVAGVELIGWLGLVTLMPRAAARSASEERTFSFSGDGVTAASAHGSQRFEWSHWRRWRRVGDLYLLRGSGSVFTFVPRRAFDSEHAESEFQELLGEHLGQRRPAAADA